MEGDTKTDHTLDWSDLHHLSSQPTGSSGSLCHRLITSTCLAHFPRAYRTARPPSSSSLPYTSDLEVLSADGKFDTAHKRGPSSLIPIWTLSRVFNLS